MVTASIPIMSGDVIVMATDGLFDNIDLSKFCILYLDTKKWVMQSYMSLVDDVVKEVQDWESEWFVGEEDNIRTPHHKGVEPINNLAQRLVLKARYLSSCMSCSL